MFSEKIENRERKGKERKGKKRKEKKRKEKKRKKETGGMKKSRDFLREMPEFLD
jgi:hypothetical protein